MTARIPGSGPDAPRSRSTSGADRARPSAGTWVLGGSALYLAVVGFVTAGLSGLLLVVGVIGLATASHALLTGRRTWALIPSRTVAAGCLAACLVLTSFGAALARPFSDADFAARSASSTSNTSDDADAQAGTEAGTEAAGAERAPTTPPAEITMALPGVTPPIIAERKVLGAPTDPRSERHGGTQPDAHVGTHFDAHVDTFAMTRVQAIPMKNACWMAPPSTCKTPH